MSKSNTFWCEPSGGEGEGERQAGRERGSRESNENRKRDEMAKKRGGLRAQEETLRRRRVWVRKIKQDEEEDERRESVGWKEKVKGIL